MIYYIFDLSDCKHIPSIIAAIKLFNLNNISPVVVVSSDFLYKEISNYKSTCNFEITYLNKKVLFDLMFKKIVSLINTMSFNNAFYQFLICIFSFKCFTYIRSGVESFMSPTYHYPLTSVKVFFKRLLIGLSDGYIFGTKNILLYLKDYLGNKPAIVIPFSSYPLIPDSEIFDNDQYFTIVIPGVIDETKKEISKFIEILKFSNQKNLKVIFLGVCKSKFEYDLLNNAPNYVKYFDDYIDESTFNSVLSKSDCLIALFKNPVMSSDGYYEYYGKTKDSGIEGHTIAFKKPCIYFKNDLSTKFDLSSNELYFKTAEQFDALIDFLRAGNTFNTCFINDHQLQELSNHFKECVLV